MNAERRVLIRELGELRRDIRWMVSKLRSMEPPEMSDEWAVQAMEVAAQMGVIHNKLLFNKPLDDPERIDSSFPF